MKKFKNIIFIIIFILISIGIVVFNYKMDPYNFEKHIKNEFLDVYSIPTNLAYVALEQSHNKKYDLVFIAGSSGLSSLPFNSLVENTSKRIARLSFAGISPKEEYEILEYFLKLHPETKSAIISLELFTYLKCYRSYILTKEDKNVSKLRTFFKLYYSFDAIKNSIKKYKKNRNKAVTNSNNKEYFLANQRVKCAYFNSCLDKNIIYLQKMKDLLEEKQIKTLFFMPPYHSLFAAQYEYRDKSYYIEETKKKYAEITLYYDMLFANHYTTIKWKDNYLFSDLLHLAPVFPHYAEVELTNILLHGKNDESISNYVTKENVEEIIEKQRIPLIKYVEENKKDIEDFINFPYKKELANSYIQKKFYKDIPEEHKQKYYGSQIIK